MKLPIVSALAIAAIGAVSAYAIAEDRPTTKGPPQTMGDEGKLPASETMRNAVPDMTGNSAASGESSGASGSTAPDGRLRMGDEPGKLPATGTVSGKVPDMRGPAPGEK
jgi:hypothetical protein